MTKAQVLGRREQAEQEAKLEEAIAKAAEEIIDKFEEQWKPAMENLQEAESVFDDLDGESNPTTTSCSFSQPFLCGHAPQISTESQAHSAREIGASSPSLTMAIWSKVIDQAVLSSISGLHRGFYRLQTTCRGYCSTSTHPPGLQGPDQPGLAGGVRRSPYCCM